MGIFPKRTKSKLKNDNYLTISTPTKQQPKNDSKNSNKQSKIWKGFRGFHAKKKKQNSQSSPRTVMDDPSAFNIGCFETNGDTSYEVSFLSENSLASPGKQETYFHGRSKSPSKVNTSTSSTSSFSSLLLRRKSSSSSTYNPNQKSDVFDNYYKKEEESQKKVFDEYYEKEQEFSVPVQSLRNYNTPKKEEEEDDDDDEEEFESPSSEKQNINEEIDPLIQEVIRESASQEEDLQTDTFDSDPVVESSPIINSTSTTTTATPSTPTQSESAATSSEKNDKTPTKSFVDAIPCQPLAQLFACATDLTEFEKMLFGDDLLPVCTNNCETILDGKNGEMSTKPTSNQQMKGDYFHNLDAANDDPSLMVDTFLSQATKRGIPLVYYQPKNAQESEWDAHDITMYVTPGRRDEHVSVPPKLMWVARDNASHSNTNVYQHLDLNEVDSILIPEDGNEEEENEMEQVCFSLITKTGMVYIFEALDIRQRNFVVESLQIVVSRLAFV